MSKWFNHKNKQQEEAFEWEDFDTEGYSEEYAEEGFEGEEYANGEAIETEYADEETYDGENTLNMEEESYEDGVYEAETYEEADSDMAVSQEEPVSYWYEPGFEGDDLEEAEEYEGEPGLEETEVYGEGAAAEEYYEEEAYYEEENYEENSYGDEEYYEDEDEEDNVIVPWSAMSDENIFSRMWSYLVHLSVMDRVVAVAGVLVLVLAIATGAVFLTTQGEHKQVTSFQTVGNFLDGVTIIGEQGLTAVADAQLAKIQAANAIEDDDNENDKDYEEGEYTKEVEVAINMTSIEKDLKIKFVNNKTNKLIANVPFSITVKTPSGTTETWKDDDMDGIIYKSDITPGEYSVSLNTLEDKKYADYIMNTSSKKVTVKKEIVYEKVDVSDEIKGEDEIDVSEEEGKGGENEIESTLKDTVGWVESTQTVIDAIYTAVEKKNIPDPLATARAGTFYRAGTLTLASLELTVGSTGTISLPNVDGVTFGTPTFKVIDGTSYITVSEGGMVTALEVGTATVEVKVTGTHTDATVTDGSAQTEEYIGTCTVKVNAATVAVDSVSLNKTTLTLTVGGTETLTATISPDTASNKNLSWSSSASGVATVSANGTVTAVGAGTATITVTTANGKTATCTVTVTQKDNRTLTVTDPKDGILEGVVGEKGLSFSVTVSNGSADSGFIVTPENSDIVTVWSPTLTDGKYVFSVTAKNIGDVTLQIALVDNPGISTKVTVHITDIKTMTVDQATMSLAEGQSKTLTVTVDGKVDNVSASSDNNAVTIKQDSPKYSESTKKTTVTITVTGASAGSATIKISCTGAKDATCTVKVAAKTTRLLDANKQQLYVLVSGNTYREATYEDYYNESITKFYVKTGGVMKYTGWQTIDGKVYYFDASGKKVTGEQVIQGAKYNFDNDGALMPGNGTFGIDVSKWNGTIDWNAVKNSGVNYVIIRCGYRGYGSGVLVEDPKFAENIKGATAAGIKVGVYFFTQAINKSEAVEEASMVLQLIKNYKISYPVFLDVEYSGAAGNTGRADNLDKTTRTDIIKAFCETIQNSGYTAGVYANKSWLTNMIDASQLSKYKIWLAQYAAAPTYTGKYDMWQYSSQGKVTGISGSVDLNISYLGY